MSTVAFAPLTQPASHAPQLLHAPRPRYGSELRAMSAGHQCQPSLSNADANVLPAAPIGNGEFEVEGGDAQTLNARLADLIARGALITALVPAHSGLVAQFREAVRSAAPDAGGAS